MPGEVRKAAPARCQHAVVALALVLAAPVLIQIQDGWRLPVLLVLGMALGATLYLNSFMFAAAYRGFMLRGESAGMRAQILMIAPATILFAPALAAGAVFGQPVSAAAAPVGLQIVAGAFLFGLGMQFAGSGFY